MPTELSPWYTQFITKQNLELLVWLIGFVGLVFAKGRTTVNRLKNLEKSLNFVEKELRPNAGGSIKDKIDSLEKSVLFLKESSLENRSIILSTLKRLDERQHILLNDHECGVFETDAGGHCVWINKKYEEMTGKTLAQMHGSGWRSTIHEADLPRIIDLWEAALREKSYLEYRCRVVNSAAEELFVRCRVSPIIHGEEVLGYVGLVCQV